MIFKNVFHKGLVTDLDVSKRGPDVWDFPTMNIRILNKDGQGLIVTNISGNTKFTHDVNGAGIPPLPFDGENRGQSFRITQGYTILGACELNGIAYIISSDGVNTEIGSMPAPYEAGPIDDAYEYANGFVRRYKPLKNLEKVAGVISDMNTDKLGFILPNSVEVFPRYSYDNTVDLFICNGVVSNKIVNTNFDLTGVYKNRIYLESNLYSLTSQIQVVKRDTSVRLDRAIPGSLLTGNYFFYPRYQDADFNSTYFVGESGPVALFVGDETHIGVSGGDNAETSGHGVSLIIDNIDTSFKFLEIAYIRYIDNGNGIVTSETKLIDKKWAINDQSTMTIEITEVGIDLSLTESIIGTEKVPDIACKSHLQLNNRYFGANWSGVKAYDESLADFAKLIQIEYDDTYTMPCNDEVSSSTPPPVADNTPIFNHQYQYIGNAYNYVGYFRGEIYAFGIIYEFLDGSYSEVYPLHGKDDMYKNAIDENDNGIYRFPSNKDSNFYTGDTINIFNQDVYNGQGLIRLMAVKFNLLAAKQAQFNPGKAITKVRSLAFVRMDRKPTLLSQGIMISQTKSHEQASDDNDNRALTRLWTNTFDNQGNLSHFAEDYNVDLLNTIQGEYPAGFARDRDIQLSNDFTGVGDNYAGFPTGKFTQPVVKFNWTIIATLENDGQLDNRVWGTMKYKNGYVPYNLVNMGLNPGAIPYTVPSSLDEGNSPAMERKYSDIYVPFLFGYYGAHYKLGSDKVKNYLLRSALQIGKYGFFSVDTFLNDKWDMSQGRYVMKVCDYYEQGTDIYGARNYADIYNNASPGDTQLYPNNYTIEPTIYKYAPTNILRKIKNGAIEQVINRDPGNTTKIGQNEYINQALDYWQGGTPWVSAEKKSTDISQKQNWSSRSFVIAPYHAIELEVDNLNANMNFDIVNVYNQDISLITGNSFENYYNTISGSWFRISNFIDINFIQDNITCFRGDCFIQKTWIKHTAWRTTGLITDATKFNSQTDALSSSNTSIFGENFKAQPPVYFTAGQMICLITENATNSALRYANPDKDGTFYPQVNDKSWANKAAYTTGLEQRLYNHSAEKTLSPVLYRFYNINAPTQEQVKRTTRIRFSALHEPYSFSDGYRMIDFASFRDYDINMGPINKIEEFLGQLISIQDRSINQHYIEATDTPDDQNLAVKIQDQSGSLIASPRFVLSDQTRKLSDFGSQHQWSIKKAFKGIYGWDWRRRIIWRVSLSKNSDGSMYSSAEDLTNSKMIQGHIKGMADLVDVNGHSDITASYPDTPAIGKGIITGRDTYYTEVLFTLLNDDKPENNTTICFSEEVDAFTSLYSFYPGSYLNIGNNMFTAKYKTGNEDTSFVYMHNLLDADGSRTVFYGSKYASLLSFIVNGIGEENSTVDFIKRFYNIQIEAPAFPYNPSLPPAAGDIDARNNHMEIDTIKYTTLYQEAYMNPFLQYPEKLDPSNGRFWMCPQYVEGKWKFPIDIQTSSKSNDYDINSQLIGTYLKITIEFSPNILMFVKSVLTNYEISQS